MGRTSLGNIRDAAIILVILAVFVAVVRPAIVAAQETNPFSQCVTNAFNLELVMEEYLQDYDDVLPPLTPSLKLAQDIGPYAKPSSAAFLLTCPITQLPYALNLSISGHGVYALPAGTQLFQDSQPHPDGESTIGFVDGVVTYGGIEQHTSPAVTAASCTSNAQQVSQATLQYEQDYDELLPTYRSYSDFETVVTPYIRNTADFECPNTLLPYVINKSLSGIPLVRINAPSATKFIQDARPHIDGTITSGFVDGHAKQVGQ